MQDFRYIDGALVGDRYKSGMEFVFRIAVPNAEREAYALWLEHDGLNVPNAAALKRLADEGCAPYCVCVGVAPGTLIFENGEKRDRRMNSYDLFSSEYGDFIVFELIPYIEKEYGIRFYNDPDMRCVSGGSSGGISAFAIAWFHSEYFHRVYMSSPTFLALGRGNEVPYLIRKYETKPLKIYEEYSEIEPNNYFGASYPIDLEAKMALEFAGYDFACAYFAGEGHCSRYYDEDSAYLRGKWIWRDYQTKKIVPPRNSPRVERIIESGSVWETVEAFPEKKVIKSVLSEWYDVIAEAPDRQIWYAANVERDVVYAYAAGKELCLKKRVVHAALHSILEIEPKGAIDMATDQSDRLYVLTAIGIQCVRAFGLIDAILDLPPGKPLKIAVTDALYVKTDRGVYRRALKPELVQEGQRRSVNYYD